MTAKEYLQQAYRLDELINSNIAELERLRTLSVSISAPKFSGDGAKTSGHSDKIGNIVSKIVDLENEINADIDRYVDLQSEIRKQINKIENNNLRLILRKRYLNSEKWEQIAIDFGFSTQWVHDLHKQALNEFKKIIRT